MTGYHQLALYTFYDHDRSEVGLPWGLIASVLMEPASIVPASSTITHNNLGLGLSV